LVNVWFVAFVRLIHAMRTVGAQSIEST
jgi:hypothetical protein